MSGPEAKCASVSDCSNGGGAVKVYGGGGLCSDGVRKGCVLSFSFSFDIVSFSSQQQQQLVCSCVCV